ncbi:MOSC domain-containing protein [Streptomyces albus]
MWWVPVSVPWRSGIRYRFRRSPSCISPVLRRAAGVPSGVPRCGGTGPECLPSSPPRPPGRRGGPRGEDLPLRPAACQWAAPATLDRVRSAVPGVPVDERRFRPDLLVRTPPGTPPFVEDEWSVSKARIGDAVCVEFVRSSERCVTTNEAQQDLPAPRWCCGPSQKPMPCGRTGSPRSCRRDRWGRETRPPRPAPRSPHRR